jgi:hypothetical protein
MCYKSPGPRCSYHAKKQLIKAKAELNEKVGKISMQEYAQLQSSIDKAQLDFDSTPAGMAILELSIERGEDETGEIAARLDYCRANRKAMLASIKAIDEGDTGNHERIPLPKLKDADFAKDNQMRKAWDIRFLKKKLETNYALHSEHVAQTLNLEETKALEWYSGDGFRHINPYLLKQADENYEDNTHPMDKPTISYPEDTLKNSVKQMDAAFEKNRLTKSILAYRGLRKHNFPQSVTKQDPTKSREEQQQKYIEHFEETYKTGSIHTFPYYLSTSVDPAAARGFNDVPVMMEIKTRSVLPLGFVSAWGDREKEMLIQRDRKFKVIGIRKNIDYAGTKGTDPSRVTVIQLEEIIEQ